MPEPTEKPCHWVAAEPEVAIGFDPAKSGDESVAFVTFRLDASGHIPDAALGSVWELLTPEAKYALYTLRETALEHAVGMIDPSNREPYWLRSNVPHELSAAIATLRLGGIK